MDKQDTPPHEPEDESDEDLSDSELDTIIGGRTPHAYPLPPFTGGGMPMPFWNEPTPSAPLTPPAADPQDRSGQ